MKGKAEGRAALLQGREINAIAGVAACAVIAYTDGHNDGQNDQYHYLLQC